jgi:hypothetical protein
VDSQGIIICLFIVTTAIIDGRFNVDSQGIIICLFIVTAAIFYGRFNVDSQGIFLKLPIKFSTIKFSIPPLIKPFPSKTTTRIRPEF